MTMNFTIIVHEEIDQDTQKALKRLIEFLDLWAEVRHGYPSVPILYGEKAFRTDYHEMDSLAPQIVDEIKNNSALPLTYENTSVMFLSKSGISLPDGSTPEGYCDIYGSFNSQLHPINIFVQISDVAEKTKSPSGDVLNQYRFIQWNAQHGRNISHEWTHEILWRQGKTDKLDYHRDAKDYWLYSTKVPALIDEDLNIKELFSNLEATNAPVEMIKYPYLNWNYITQRVDPNW
jgi:hypothetical protein